MTRLAITAVLCAAALAAQPPRTPRPETPQYKPEDACTVEGLAVNAATGEPLRKASVRLRRADGGYGARSYTATTDAAGKFTIANVAPGSYRLSAQRNGFVDTDWAAGAPFSLTPRQRLADVSFRMLPHGVITGRVVDEDGEAVAGIDVYAMRYRYPQGRRQLSTFGEASTNDLGEYRIYGLPPGRYLLRATPHTSYGRGGPAGQPEEQYVPTFFPGAPDAASAAPVEVAAGGQVRGLDMTLARKRTVRVRGRVVDNTGGSNRRRAMVFLRTRDGGSNMRPSSVDGSGNFEIAGVMPGSYTLVAAISERGEGGLTARMPLEVGGGGVDNVVLNLNPPITVAGRVRLEGQQSASVTRVQVSLRTADPFSFGGPPSARVQADGSFRLANVSPDEYYVVLSGLPDGYYVKAIAAAGQDVLLTGIDFSRGALPIDVFLSPNAGQAAGVVLNQKQEPEPEATVVLVPAEKERMGLAQFYRTAKSDASGRFALKNLDPGRYNAYAWREIEPGAWLDPDFMKPLELSGEPVTIRESGQEEIKLRLAP
ncbi:MAG: collagen binding domain-containing protein [Bryobacteraceae bacterium]